MLQNQTALVSGAGSGIGRAISRSLAKAGARVALAGRDPEKLDSARRELADEGQAALALSCDVTNRDQVRQMTEKVLAEFGSLDILVCNAGINVPQRSFRSLDPADWDRIIETNLTGAFNLVHFALPSMRERGQGLVIQIASVSGLRANVLSGAAYSASKFGQAALGVCLGREERGRGIRSTVIYPGEVNTSFLDARSARPGGDAKRREGILEPEDVAAAVVFVAQLPSRVHIPELLIKPAIDDFC